MVKLAVVVFAVLAVVSANSHQSNRASKVKAINNAQNSWTASLDSHIAQLNKQQFRKLLGAKKPRNLARLPRKQVSITSNIPDTFDAREKWPDCPSISSIKDQGHCRSCWAVASAACASDRLCISTNNKLNLSAENLLACCSECAPQGGCNGGYPLAAWIYIIHIGIVTGGDYDSGEGCQPYEIQPTGRPTPSSNEANYEGTLPTPSCKGTCTNYDYGEDYENDLHYGQSAYLLSKDVAQIQTDLMNNGPSEATFTVYDDFQYYKEGVYVKSRGAKEVECHAVRLIGWGNEKGVPYWLVANSWNTGFGEGGLFKIRRGTNECGFEEFITGGTF